MVSFRQEHGVNNCHLQVNFTLHFFVSNVDTT